MADEMVLPASGCRFGCAEEERQAAMSFLRNTPDGRPLCLCRRAPVGACWRKDIYLFLSFTSVSGMIK